jgi:multiple sugar transport system substrate-binding protein
MLTGALGVAGLAGLAACAAPTPGASPSASAALTAPVRFGIFGNAEKLRIRGLAIAEFSKTHKTPQVSFEGVTSDSWPEKIAAMVAGGNAPDALALGTADIVQYGKRGALAPLTDLPEFDEKNYDKAVLDLGRGADGKLYGAPIATSLPTIGYNVTALDRLQADPLPASWTYDKYAGYCKSVFQEGDGSLHGTQDFGGLLAALQAWLLSQGKPLFKGQKLAAKEGDIKDWLSYWDKLRKNGAAVPADLTAQFTGQEWPNSPLVKGRAVFALMATQDIQGGYQALMTDHLSVTLPPSATGADPGLYPSATSSMCVYARSKAKHEAAFVVNWFVSDPASAKILGLISGPPAAKPALAEVLKLKDTSELEKDVLKYSKAAGAKSHSAPAIPLGFTDVQSLLRRVNEDIGFGKSSVAQGASDFMSQVTGVLANA